MNANSIRKSIEVRRPPELVFRLFCEEIGIWWPESFGGKDARLTLETRVGGRFFETRADGTEYLIGLVNRYEPPRVVAFTWRAPSWSLETQVEIRFSAIAGGTRIDLEHGGFDQEPALREARSRYDNGWQRILGMFAQHAEIAAA